jgi:hypothetical protein
MAAAIALVVLEFPAAMPPICEGGFGQGTGVTAGKADFPAGKTVRTACDEEDDSADGFSALDDNAAGVSP